MKTTRLAPGFYTTTINGVTYEISNVGGDVAGFTGWVWNVVGESANDIFATKRDALAALEGFIAETAPAVSMMERMARAAEATRPAGCKTLVMG
jgi:hypothetical protein